MEDLANPTTACDNKRSKNAKIIIDPRHEISYNVVCATSKASDQPTHTRSLIRAFACRLNILMTVKLLTGHHLEFLSLKGGYVGLSASTIVKMPHFGNHMSRLNYYVKGRLWDSISGFIYKPCL